MRKWYRMAAAIAMLGLVMACLTPAAAVVPTATGSPIPVTAPSATPPPTTAPTKRIGGPLTPKERAATKTAEASQAGQPGQAPTSAPAAPGQQPGLVSDKVKHIIIIMQENRS